MQSGQTTAGIVCLVLVFALTPGYALTHYDIGTAEIGRIVDKIRAQLVANIGSGKKLSYRNILNLVKVESKVATQKALGEIKNLDKAKTKKQSARGTTRKSASSRRRPSGGGKSGARSMHNAPERALQTENDLPLSAKWNGKDDLGEFIKDKTFTLSQSSGVLRYIQKNGALNQDLRIGKWIKASFNKETILEVKALDPSAKQKNLMQFLGVEPNEWFRVILKGEDKQREGYIKRTAIERFFEDKNKYEIRGTVSAKPAPEPAQASTQHDPRPSPDAAAAAEREAGSGTNSAGLEDDAPQLGGPVRQISASPSSDHDHDGTVQETVEEVPPVPVPVREGASSAGGSESGSTELPSASHSIY